MDRHLIRAVACHCILVGDSELGRDLGSGHPQDPWIPILSSKGRRQLFFRRRQKEAEGREARYQVA